MQRKSSNETLASIGMDSTLDSRMSSAEIPQMELLKVNYVHQCKEALLPRSQQQTQFMAAHSRIHAYAQPRAHAPSHNVQHDVFKRSSCASSSSSKHANVTKVLVSAEPSTHRPSSQSRVKPQSPPPPPIVESWNLLQQRQQERDAREVCHFGSPPKRHVDADLSHDPLGSATCCNSRLASTSEDDDDDTSTVAPDCEKSNSWNYRAKVSTCDIRRDLARAGIKSRADRIARIEQTDCDHQRAPKGQAQRASLPAIASTPPAEFVSQLKCTQSEQRRSLKVHRAPSPPLQGAALALPQPLPPQPRRPAPLPVKQPNVRHRGSTGAIGLASDERVKRLSSGAVEYCDCKASNFNEPKEMRSSFGGRFRETTATAVNGGRQQPMSRIPKPISSVDNQRPLSTSSAYLFNEANEQLQRRIKQMFQQEQGRRQQATPKAEKSKLRATKSAAFEPKTESQAHTDSCNELNDQLLKQARHQVPAGNYPKMKMERVHIRKKRQPLLIINQLNELKMSNSKANIDDAPKQQDSASNEMVHHKSEENGSRRTCGYKNCNYTNCPMSTKDANNSTPHESDEEAYQRKRLSLESCSDSGVSSSTDVKEHTKENNIKNLEKCADCVKILLTQNSTEVVTSSTRRDSSGQSYQHHKLSPQNTKDIPGKQLKEYNNTAEGHHKLSPQNTKDFPGKELKEYNNTAEGQIQIHVGKALGADPNDVQNFAKKNVTKATTDELLTAAVKNNNNSQSNSACSTARTSKKQCNIEYDLKNNEHRKYNNKKSATLNSTTIKIDDDWVQEHQDTPMCIHDGCAMDADSLMIPSTNLRSTSPAKSVSFNNNHNGTTTKNNNSVKIFVRSSNAATGCGNTSRASTVSVSSYASQTSGCSTKSSSSSASHVTNSSTSGDSYASGSDGSSAASVNSSQCNCHSAMDEDRADDAAYFCQLGRMTAAGVFFNRASQDLDRMQSDTLRARAASPTASTGTYSEVSCVSCNGDESGIGSAVGRCNIDGNGSEAGGTAATKRRSTISGGGAYGGVYWNNSYFQHDVDPEEVNADDGEADTDVENQCCCSLTSCDDDNCSYYEGDSADSRCMTRVVEVRASVHSSHEENKNSNKFSTKNCCSNDSDNERDRERRQERERYELQQQHQQQQLQRQRLRDRERGRQMQLLRNSSIEEILIQNKKLLRKADVIHELRPRSMDGTIDSPSAFLNGDTTGSSPDSGDHVQNQQDSEARRIHRGHVLTELLETERSYVNEMASILKGYRDQMLSEEMMHLVPASLQGKEDILFGNLHELYTFHNEIFLKDLENCISTTELVALCFVQRRDTFYRLYSFYCQNIPRSERLRETLVDTHLFLQECQQRLGHKLPLGAYLLKPVQRITKYKLLLENLLGSSDSGSCTKELQKALDCMMVVLRCVNDSMHQVAITGFPSDLSQQGELLLQDPFQVWTEAKKDIRLRIKPQQRHIFLYQKSMIFCKKTSKPGHNKSTYQFKHQLKMSQIGLTESVRGDSKRFEVWLQGRQEVHTLQATTDDVKKKWVAEIKRVLLNQLEELKGEKIKQYGMNHHGLRQTTSWDTPNILLGMQQRAISCDASSESSNRNSNCSSSGDDAYHGMAPLSSGAGSGGGGGGNATGLGNGSSGCGTNASDEKEQQEACAWSSDYSNSDEEMSLVEDNSAPGSKFVALADYVAMGHSEVSMREGDTVELLKVGCAGWWFVRVLEANTEGWTPAAYLEPLNRKSSRSSSRNQERINFSKYPE